MTVLFGLVSGITLDGVLPQDRDVHSSRDGGGHHDHQGNEEDEHQAVYHMIETVVVPPTPYPTGFLWWFRNGDSWHAPEVNNGLPYLPDIHVAILRDLLWFCRNPIGNFMGFVIGFEGLGYVVKGPAPVMQTTLYDAVPPQYGWKWCVINGWAPFVAYSGKRILWYLGWRPASGGFGFKLNFHI